MATPVAGSAASALKSILADAARDVFGGARAGAARAFNTGEFLAGPEPSNPIGRFQHRAGRRVCDQWARGERFNTLPGNELLLSESCNPYLGPNAPGNPTTSPDFTGGQCPVLYRVAIDYRRVGFSCSTGQENFRDSSLRTESPAFNRMGPISFVARRGINPNCGGFRTFAFDFTTGSGSPFTLTPDSVSTSQRLELVDVNIRMIRIDGLADSCGNPVDKFRPGPRTTSPNPTPGPVGPPIGFPFPGVDVTISPTGEINVDFGDGTPPVPIGPDEGPSGGGGGGGGGTPPPAPGDQGTAGAGGSTGEGGTTEGEAPEGSVIVGLKLDLVNTPPQRFSLGSNLWRGGAYIYMGGNVALDQDFAGSILANSQFVFAEKDNLTKWRVRARFGFNWNVTPYYRQVTE